MGKWTALRVAVLWVLKEDMRKKWSKELLKEGPQSINSHESMRKMVDVAFRDFALEFLDAVGYAWIEENTIRNGFGRKLKPDSFDAIPKIMLPRINAIGTNTVLDFVQYYKPETKDSPKKFEDARAAKVKEQNLQYNKTISTLEEAPNTRQKRGTAKRKWAPRPPAQPVDLDLDQEEIQTNFLIHTTRPQATVAQSQPSTEGSAKKKRKLADGCGSQATLTPDAIRQALAWDQDTDAIPNLQASPGRSLSLSPEPSPLPKVPTLIFTDQVSDWLVKWRSQVDALAVKIPSMMVPRSPELNSDETVLTTQDELTQNEFTEDEFVRGHCI